MSAKKISHYIYRDAKTGRLVTEDYAKKNPGTTVKEAVYEN
jgi:hypothetical protein